MITLGTYIPKFVELPLHNVQGVDVRALTRVLQCSIAARNGTQSCIVGGNFTLLVSSGNV